MKIKASHLKLWMQNAKIGASCIKALAVLQKYKTKFHHSRCNLTKAFDKIPSMAKS